MSGYDDKTLKNAQVLGTNYDRALDDMRHLISGDPTLLWVAPRAVPDPETKVRKQLRQAIQDIVTMLPEGMVTAVEEVQAEDDYACTMRIQATYNRVIPLVVVIAMRYWDHISRVECKVLIKDSTKYEPTARFHEEERFMARSLEEMDDLKLRVRHWIATRSRG